MTKAELINLIAEKRVKEEINRGVQRRTLRRHLQLLLILYQRHLLTARRSHW